MVTIRKATAVDAQGILDSLAEAFAPYRESYTTGAFADTVLTQDSLVRRLTDMTILVAVDEDGSVMGTVSYQVQEHAEGHIRGMAVRARWQGLGVAKALLDEAEAGLRQLRCTAISLETTRPLERAIRFYEKSGFQATAEITDFFGMDLLHYRKAL